MKCLQQSAACASGSLAGSLRQHRRESRIVARAQLRAELLCKPGMFVAQQMDTPAMERTDAADADDRCERFFDLSPGLSRQSGYSCRIDSVCRELGELRWDALPLLSQTRLSIRVTTLNPR